MSDEFINSDRRLIVNCLEFCIDKTMSKRYKSQLQAVLQRIEGDGILELYDKEEIARLRRIAEWKQQIGLGGENESKRL